MIGALFDPKKSVYMYNPCFQIFENNQVIAACDFITLTHEMTMTKKFVMIDLIY